MKKYESLPIENLREALEVRNIRNECRLFMTNDTSEINLIKQVIWYFRVYRKENEAGKMTCFLFNVNGTPAGFGLIGKRFGKYWITGGLKSDQRGKGMGKILFREIVEKIPSNEVWLEVLDSNIIAKNLYKNLGFKKIKKRDIDGKKIIVMKLVTEQKNK